MGKITLSEAFNAGAVMLKSVALALAAMAVLVSFAQAQPPVSAFGALPAVEDVSISPDGRHVAVALHNDTGDNVRVYEVTAEGATYVAGTDVAAIVPVSSVNFLDDQRILVSNLAVFNLSTSEHLNMALGVIAPFPGDPGFGRALDRKPSMSDVLRVDLKTGEYKTLELTPPDTTIVIFNPSGEAVARAESDPVSNRWKILARVNGRWRKLLSGKNETGAPPPLAVIFSDGRLVFLESAGPERTKALWAIDPSTGVREILMSVQEFDITSVIADRRTAYVVGAGWFGGAHYEQRFFEPTLEAARVAIAAQFPEGFVRLLDWDRNLERFVFYAEEPGNAGKYYLYDRPGSRIVALAMSYPALDGVTLSSAQSIIWRAMAKRSPHS